MSLNRHAVRRDANEGPIVAALEQVGAEVWITDRPADLLVWFRGAWHVMEIKTGRGRLSAAQSADRAVGRARGIALVRTPLEALEAIGAVRR